MGRGGGAVTPEAAARAEPARTGWGTLATVNLGYLLISWGMAPISAILPTISADLQIDMTAAGWVMNAYFLLLVGAILITGRIGDLYGHRRVFLCGIFVFGLASVAAGFTSRFEPLVFARAVQGLGSAMVFGASLALVTEAVPSGRRGLAIGTLTMSAGAASLLGVVFSVYAVEQLSWHWAFFIPVPLWLLSLGLAWRLPAGASLGSRAKLDWQGGLLLFAMLTVALLSLNHLHEGEENFTEGAHYHLPMHFLALALLAAFAWVETRVPQPLLNLKMLRDAHFASGVFANGVAHMSMLGSSFLLPFLLERGQGLAPSDTGRLMLAMQVLMLVCSLGAGVLYDRTRTPLLGWASLGAIAGGFLVLGLVGGSLPYLVLVVIAALLGAGLGGFTTVNNAAIMGSAAAGLRGFASGMIETTRQFGHSVGVSLSSSVMASALAGVALADRPAAYAAGFEQATLVMGIMSTLGLLAIILPDIRGRGADAGARPAAAGRPAAT
jgi:MFS family permease